MLAFLLFSCGDFVELSKTAEEQEVKIYGDIFNQKVVDGVLFDDNTYLLSGNSTLLNYRASLLIRVDASAELVSYKHLESEGDHNSINSLLNVSESQTVYACGDIGNGDTLRLGLWNVNESTLETQKLYASPLSLVNKVSGVDVIRSQDAHLYTLGNIFSTDVNDSEFLLSKIEEATSNVIWEKVYGFDQTEDVAQNLFETLDGDLVIVGTTLFNGFLSPRIIKLNSYGDIIWDRIISRQASELQGSRLSASINEYGLITLVSRKDNGEHYLTKVSSSQGDIVTNNLISTAETSGSSVTYSINHLSRDVNFQYFLLGKTLDEENSQMLMMSVQDNGQVTAFNTWGGLNNDEGVKYFPETKWVLTNLEMSDKGMVGMIKNTN